MRKTEHYTKHQPMTVDQHTPNRPRSEVIANWYVRLFPKVAAYVQKQGGTLDAAKEVFQETLMLYCEKRTCTDFTPIGSEQAYLFGIAKNRWLKLRAEDTHQELGNFDVADEPETTPLTHKLLDYLKLSGERCLDLLQAFYFEKLNASQLAQRFGYSSERSATVQKYKCLEKVRHEVKQKSLSYEDFFS